MPRATTIDILTVIPITQIEPGDEWRLGTITQVERTAQSMVFTELDEMGHQTKTWLRILIDGKERTETILRARPVAPRHIVEDSRAGLELGDGYLRDIEDARSLHSHG